MLKIDLEARAKINLTLDVLYKRPDGYHEVEMIMQSIALKDRLTVELLPKKIIELACDRPGLSCDETNLAWKAAKLMMDEFKVDAGVRIKLYKNIPVAAGLAGGSANAAAVILGLNELFQLKKSKEELMKLGKRIGADVPFCIQGGTALARGIGEKLVGLKPAPKISLLLIKPPYFVSSKEVYSRLDLKNIKERPDTPAVLNAIEKQDAGAIGKGLCNVLEGVTFGIYPELADIKRELARNGALGSLMSGSGPTVYGIFETEREAQRAAGKMPRTNSLIFVSEVD